MYPRDFEYIAATDLDQALNALATAENAKVMSGGMSLMPLMKMRLLSPETVVDIGRIDGLDYIEDRGDHIAVGALVRHAAVAGSALLGEHARAVTQAASWTGDGQIRNWGTLCGALAHADLAADTPAAALALGATMVARSASGERTIAAGEFFVDTLTSALALDEILTEVRFPKQGGGSAYDKLGRRGGHSDYAVAGAAAWVKLDGGTVADCAVGITGVGTKPSLATGVADALRGTDGSAEAIAAAADRAVEGITVLEDLYGSVEYKSHLAKVYARRAIEQAMA